jgi:hypothetical protein
VCLSRRFLFLDGKMVNFGDCSSTVLAFKPAVNCVNHGSSSWNGGPDLKQRESIHFGDFWHINDDFAQYNTKKTIFKAENAPSY